MIKKTSARAFQGYICSANSHGYDGYRLVIKPHESQTMCVQFLIKRDKNFDSRILFCVPRARWAEKFFPEIVALIEKHGLEHTIIDNEISSRQAVVLPKIISLVKKFLCVDCGHDLNLMVDLTEKVFAVLGWDDSDLFDVGGYGKRSIRAKFKPLEVQT